MTIEAMQNYRQLDASLGMRCHFCQRELDTLADSFLEFYDDLRLIFPIRRGVGLLAHRGCGPDRGYAICLDKLRERKGGSCRTLRLQTFEDWQSHLWTKSWCTPRTISDLSEAYDFVPALAAFRDMGAPPLWSIQIPDSQMMTPSADAVRSNNTERRICSPTMRALVLERDEFRCRRCGATPDGSRDRELQIDHKTPYTKSGPTTLANLQTLCRRCNLGKGSRVPHSHDLRP